VPIRVPHPKGRAVTGWVESDEGGFQSLARRSTRYSIWPLKFEFVNVPPLKIMRFGVPEPLVIWDQLHAAGSNLAVCLRAGPEPLVTVA
jgi:hypothetical protein